ncbi:cold-shock protein [Dyella telluris]|uniref:Cold shock domain-containing protein n=1 Tax=Dyella telluris TaxID=2763498 RepID=A0A7G8Q002_9GAMM|nr:cold shock domain-containing protein [Dyella telluris]QNK00110.1 cold shock domain-containing protein [Dyella telluris]
MEGTVSSFLPGKGYGFIQGDDGRSYFLHGADVLDGAAKITDGQRLSFDASATPKGYRARRVRLADASGHATFQVPTQVLHSRDPQVRGWETVEATLWTVIGSSRQSPDDARADMLAKARRLGANGVVLVQYFKTRGSEPGTGKGTHYFTIHHHRGQVVMLGRRSATGTMTTDQMQGLANRAAQLKRELEQATARSRKSAGMAAAIVVLISLAAAAGLQNFPGLIGVVFGLVLAAILYNTIATDHDGWLVRP